MASLRKVEKTRSGAFDLADPRTRTLLISPAKRFWRPTLWMA
jgi:hypothetical protein